MSNVPYFVRHARLALGETQSTFAERFGVNTTTVSRWERGKLHPSPAIYRNIRKILVCGHPLTDDDLIEACPTFKYLVRMDDLFFPCLASLGARRALEQLGVSLNELFHELRERSPKDYAVSSAHAFDIIQCDPRWLEARIAYANAHCVSVTLGGQWAYLMLVPLIERGEALAEFVPDPGGPGRGFWVHLVEVDSIPN
ncbi:MAG: helix-turn-helix transcriptional regulator [Rhodomicrobium sp.]